MSARRKWETERLPARSMIIARNGEAKLKAGVVFKPAPARNAKVIKQGRARPATRSG